MVAPKKPASVKPIICVHDRKDIIWFDCNPQVGQSRSSKSTKTSYVLDHQPKSFDWRLRGAKYHQSGKLSDTLFHRVCERLNQIIQI